MDEHNGKIFGWICADFYQDSPGDRSALGNGKLQLLAVFWNFFEHVQYCAMR
jgi:hypothetical protein